MSSSPAAHPNRDVRMRGFAARVTVASAWQWLDAQLALLPTETVRLAAAGGRVLGHSLPSPVDVPGFRRAMMDGFALHAEDTAGSSPYNPLPLAVIGQSLPAAPFAGKVARGQAVRIMTGAPVPAGADAVLPAERVAVEGEKILVQGEVSPQKNVGAVGEDVTRGTTVLQQGRRLRPQDLGLLASIGAGQVEVIRQPRVRIVVTGNEILPAGTPPRDYQIGDANGPMLAALVARDGGVVVDQRVVADDPPAILQALCGEGDVILVSGGSSVGQEDHVPTLLADHGELAVHGIAMRPSSPTGLG
ncbi:MAG: molybdopterin molybdenumtransferase MoeA, partial [Planctomycetales bacterium]|nr:molybdopterin molybdenumtransferase MoeA [Planctomycetales bacterium]